MVDDEPSKMDSFKDKISDIGQKVGDASKKAAKKTSEVSANIAEDIKVGAKKVSEDVKIGAMKVSETVEQKKEEFLEKREGSKKAKAEADDARENELLQDLRNSELLPISESTFSKEEGFVKIPRIAPVFISGLTVKEATSKLEKSLSKIYSGLTSNTNALSKTYYSLSLTKTRSIVVNIIGEVVSPGFYTISSMSSILNALYFAGGPNEVGTYRQIEIIRDGEIFYKVDLYDYFINGVSPNIFLRDQDVILVPTYKKRASSAGEFKRNNIFEILENETVLDLIKYSGEFNSLAYKSEIYIERIDGINKKIISLSKNDFEKEKLNDL